MPMRNLRVEISEELDQMLSKRVLCFGSKSFIVRSALELYLILCSKGELDGTERIEDLPRVVDKMLSQQH